MNIEQAQALAMICHYAKEYLKDNKTMSQSVDIAQDIIKKQLNALEILSENIIINEKNGYVEFFCDFSLPTNSRIADNIYEIVNDYLRKKLTY